MKHQPETRLDFDRMLIEDRAILIEQAITDTSLDNIWDWASRKWRDCPPEIQRAIERYWQAHH